MILPTDKAVKIIDGSAGYSQVTFDNGLTLNGFGVESDISANLKNKGISVYGKIYGAQATINKEVPLQLTNKKLGVSLTGDYASLGGGFIIKRGLKVGASVGVSLLQF